MISIKTPSARRVSCVFLLLAFVLGVAQVPALAGQTVEDKVNDLSLQVAQLSALIMELRSEVARSREETRELRLQLQGAKSPADAGNISAVNTQQVYEVAPSGDGNSQPEERLTLLEENHQLLADRLAEQYQTKVESASRYRTKLSGIVMLNAFSNRGRVDNEEVPDLALRPGAAETGVTRGLTALQSQLGFETYGPDWAGGKVSAGLQMDFFGISPSSQYASSWGAVRLRSALVRVDWSRTSIVVGQDTPFISPLSPTSVATLGYPAFSYSGNLWTWIPQVRVDHRVHIAERSTVSIQGGIFDPVPRTSRHPGYATRLAFSHGEEDRAMTLGVGAHYSRQDHGAGRTPTGWAGMADWSIPLGSRLALSGEIYRGRSLGSLGAAQGRSLVFDGPESDPATPSIGLNSTGGWAQLKFKASSSVEFHAAHGQDQPYLRDLLRFTPPGSSNSAISRNRTEMFNVIYRPRTDLILSLEYRRFRTSRISTTGNTAEHFNLGVGVLF